MTGKRRMGRDDESRRRAPNAPVPPATPGPPTPVPIVVAPRKTRRELRAERRRQKRRRLGAAGVAGVVVAGLIAAAAITFGVQKVTSGGDKKTLGQTTLLFSLAGASGSAVESALLAHDGRTRQGVELLMPGRVLTEVCGFGNQQLGQILALPDGQRLSRAAVSGLLGGVRVSGSWALTTAQLARLVDEVGGITVDVDVNVVHGRTLVVARGSGQRLTGPRAVAFATYFAKGEDAAGNLVRLQQVIDGLLTALPRNASGIEHLLESLGKGAASTLGSARLADFLVGLAADVRANRVLPTDLPVVKIDAGSGPSSYRIETDQTATFVQANLAASLPSSAGAQRTRVFVQNGVGTPGLVGSACSKLVTAGYAFAGSGNASHFGFTTSKVLVFDRSVASARVGNDVARSLGLPTRDVAVSTAGQNVADVLVILGKDYKR
jgi:hypothetical protein